MQRSNNTSVKFVLYTLFKLWHGKCYGIRVRCSLYTILTSETSLNPFKCSHTWPYVWKYRTFADSFVITRIFRLLLGGFVVLRTRTMSYRKMLVVGEVERVWGNAIVSYLVRCIHLEGRRILWDSRCHSLDSKHVPTEYKRDVLKLKLTRSLSISIHV
jgi:hypothetical protein